jgi:hypothetical protein
MIYDDYDIPIDELRAPGFSLEPPSIQIPWGVVDHFATQWPLFPCWGRDHWRRRLAYWFRTTIMRRSV